MRFIQKYLHETKSDSLYLFFNSVIDRGLFFLFYILLARRVDQTEYGLIISVFAFTNILQTIFDMGLPIYLQREIAAKKEWQGDLNAAVILKLLTLIFFLPIPLIYFSSLSGVNSITVLTISLISFLWGISGTINAIFYGSDKFKESSKYILISRLFLALSFAVCLVADTPLLIILFTFILSAFIHIFLFFKFSRENKAFRIHFKTKLETILTILKSSVPMGIGVIFVIIYDRADIIILQNLSGLNVVAVYSVAYSLFRALQIFGVIFLLPKYNVFSKSYFNFKIIKKRELKSLLSIIMGISLFIIFVVFLIGKDVIIIIYTSTYISSGNIFVALTLAIPGVFLNNLTGILLNSIRKEKIPAITTGFGAAFNIILNILLIGSIGIWGAVTATILTEYLVFFAQLFALFYYKSKNVFVLE